MKSKKPKLTLKKRLEIVPVPVIVEPKYDAILDIFQHMKGQIKSFGIEDRIALAVQLEEMASAARASAFLMRLNSNGSSTN